MAKGKILPNSVVDRIVSNIQKNIGNKENQLEFLVTYFKGYLIHIIRSKVKSMSFDDFEDCLQELNICLLKCVKAFNGKSTFKAYLSTACHNKVRKIISRRNYQLCRTDDMAYHLYRKDMMEGTDNRQLVFSFGVNVEDFSTNDTLEDGKKI